MNVVLNYLELLWIKFTSLDAIIQVSVSFIVFSLVATVVLMIRVFAVRRLKERQERLISEFRPKLFSFVRNIVISKDSYSEDDICVLYKERFGNLNSKAYVSLIPTLEDVVIQEKDNIDTKNYNNLIKSLKIDQHLEKKLESNSTKDRLRAFQSLISLELKVADSKILPYTYSKDTSLRKESRATYVGVSNNDPFKFFEVQDNDINNWDQINLMQQFVLHHSGNLPNFGKWIKYSDDADQVKFFVRMVAYFNQTSARKTVEALLENDDHCVRVDAILALGEMKDRQIEQKLMSMYATQPLMCQDAIIKAISYINSGRSLKFLEMAFKGANNPDSKKLIAEAIYLYGEEGKMLFDELLASENDFSLLILKHAENPLIMSDLKTYHLEGKPTWNRCQTRIAG